MSKGKMNKGGGMGMGKKEIGIKICKEWEENNRNVNRDGKKD